MQLQKPQPKVKEHVLRRFKEVNLPIPLANPSEPWPQYEGIFLGTTVLVNNIEDAAVLLNQGSFGKCIFSRGVSTPDQHSIIRKRQWKRRKEWQTKSVKYKNKENSKLSNSAQTLSNSCIEEPGNSTKENFMSDHQCNQENIRIYNTNNNNTPNEVLVVNDSDDDCFDTNTFMSNLNPKLHKESIVTVHEILCLNLEEAFFLYHALHCMTIKHISATSKSLPLEDLWKLFIKADPNFVEKYITYYYFRRRGWIVKSGLNFGCDFALYKRGPAYYHASCVVKIRNINNPNKPIYSWEDIMGYCRVSEAAKKDFVLCEVIWPSNLTPKTCDIKDISNFNVSHKILQRWTASEHREA